MNTIAGPVSTFSTGGLPQGEEFLQMDIVTYLEPTQIVNLQIPTVAA